MEVRLSGHGAYQHQYHVVWIPQYRRRILRGAIRLFVQEHLPQIQRYHPEVEVKHWSVQVDHIHVVLVIPPKYAVSSMVGKMKANLSRRNFGFGTPSSNGRTGGPNCGLLGSSLQPWG